MRRMSRLVQKIQAARYADAEYQREEARETLILWQTQDTFDLDYREKASFEAELAEAADRVRVPYSWQKT